MPVNKHSMLVKLMVLLMILFGWVPGLLGQQTMLFDNDWRFFRGNNATASEPIFDDSKWRKLDLPHDWSIEDIPGTGSPFDTAAVSHVNTGFTSGGTGWYRKTFTMAPHQRGKRIVIRFDGVYMNADFWINGVALGNHPYGYTSFFYDITDHIKWNAPNTIAVEVKNEGRNSRWYSGSGIYRHVWLQVLPPVHVAQWGTFITTPEVTKNWAAVNIKTTVQNETLMPGKIQLITKIKDAKGIVKATVTVTKEIAANTAVEFDQDVKIPAPALWSPASPALYTAVTEVYHQQKKTGITTTTFGIRRISFDAVHGFRLNGTTLKLKGGCVHHDNGPLGSKAYDRAEERKVALLKASGFNAIRTSHNPPSPAFLEACDRLGMLVIDEAFDTWNDRKNKEDYHLYFKDWWQKDLESMVKRDRNHPSVIMWSTGNEIPNRGKDEVAAVAASLTAFVKQLDNTRPVTCGVNGIDQHPDAFLEALDVPGYNYALSSYETDHERFPGRVMYGSESFPLEAYDYWKGVTDHPWVIGDFVWTAFDYIGEASIGWLGYPQSKKFYPWNLAYCGDIDICGWKRPQSYYRDVLWKKDQLSLFVKSPHPTFEDWNEKLEPWSKWNWEDVVPRWDWKGFEDSLLEVTVYSSCEVIELFLNGRSLGKKTTGNDEKFRATFQVPYQTGNLKAVGYKGNQQVAVSTLQTPGKSAGLQLSADRNIIKANNQDLSYITVELTDASGNRDFKSETPVNFSLEGPATIVGIGNGNPKSTESFQALHRKTWQGRCLVIIKSTGMPGTITLHASATGRIKSQVVVKAAP